MAGTYIDVEPFLLVLEYSLQNDILEILSEADHAPPSRLSRDIGWMFPPSNDTMESVHF